MSSYVQRSDNYNYHPVTNLDNKSIFTSPSRILEINLHWIDPRSHAFHLGTNHQKR